MTLRKIINTVVTDTAIMASGDTVNSTIIEFKDVVPLGKTEGRIREVCIIDRDKNTAANLVGELWLFVKTVTQAASNAAHDITDADALFNECIISWVAADGFLSASNSVVCKSSLDIPFNLTQGGTSLFGIWVTRATPTFAGGATGSQIVLSVDS